MFVVVVCLFDRLFKKCMRIINNQPFLASFFLLFYFLFFSSFFPPFFFFFLCVCVGGCCLYQNKPSVLQTLTSMCALPVPTISGRSAALIATLQSQPSTDLTQPITLFPDVLDSLHSTSPPL